MEDLVWKDLVIGGGSCYEDLVYEDSCYEDLVMRILLR